VINPFKKYFEEETPEIDTDMTECHQIVSFSREPYFDRFISYLDRGADAKIDTASATSMLTSAERINTYKDIKAYLKKQVREASEVIAREISNE
jgi:hypothetical protein